jgi:hypothetical protein
MTRARLSFTIFLAFVFLCAGAVTGLALGLYSLGSIEVSMKGHGCGGDDIELRLPAALVQAALMLTPDDLVCGGGKCGRQAMLDKMPLASALCRALQDTPDFVLVEVESDDERVRIEKRGHALFIDVNNPEETVRVRVPVKIVQGIVNKFARMSEA